MGNRIEYIGFFNHTGYGVAGRNYVNALYHSGLCDIKISCLGVSYVDVIDKKEHKLFQSFLQKNKDRTRIQIRHMIPNMQRNIASADKVIGMAIFETTNPPLNWIEILNKNNAVVVPSQFVYDEFLKAGISVPLVLIPHCIDIDTYKPSVTPLCQRDKFTFLFVGRWHKRKGYRELLAAWVQEFHKKENIQLIIKTDRIDLAKKYVKELYQVAEEDCADIIIEEIRYKSKDMPHFYRSVDCVISPTRGEGFGLVPLEAMAVGVPVIVTNYSGCTEYANEDTATLLSPGSIDIEVAMDGIPQFVHKHWAKISIEQIREKMRYAVTHTDIITKKAKFARQYIVNRFSYNVIAKKFNKLLNNL